MLGDGKLLMDSFPKSNKILLFEVFFLRFFFKHIYFEVDYSHDPDLCLALRNNQDYCCKQVLWLSGKREKLEANGSLQSLRSSEMVLERLLYLYHIMALFPTVLHFWVQTYFKSGYPAWLTLILTPIGVSVSMVCGHETHSISKASSSLEILSIVVSRKSI